MIEDTGGSFPCNVSLLSPPCKEAFVRFLKAKLRVLQEELDQVCQASSEKDKAMAASAARLKRLTEQNAKLQRSYQTLQVGRILAIWLLESHRCVI